MQALKDNAVVEEAANKRLAEQDPNWKNLQPSEKRFAREKILAPGSGEELKKHLYRFHMVSGRAEAGMEQAKLHQLRDSKHEHGRTSPALQKMEAGGGGGTGEEEE